MAGKQSATYSSKQVSSLLRFDEKPFLAISCAYGKKNQTTGDDTRLARAKEGNSNGVKPSAIPVDESRAFGRHRAGTHRAVVCANAWLPISLQRQEPARQAGLGVGRPWCGDLRSRVLLAPTWRLFAGITAEDASLVLGSQIVCQHAEGSAAREASATRGLASVDALGMSPELTAEVGKAFDCRLFAPR
jgi:hypothetical protein